MEQSCVIASVYERLPTCSTDMIAARVPDLTKLKCCAVVVFGVIG